MDTDQADTGSQREALYAWTSQVSSIRHHEQEQMADLAERRVDNAIGGNEGGLVGRGDDLVSKGGGVSFRVIDRPAQHRHPHLRATCAAFSEILGLFRTDLTCH